VGYLSDVDFVNHELVIDEEDEAEEDGHVEVGDNDHDDGGPAWDPEAQPFDFSEEQAIVIAMANRELDRLAMWDGLVVQVLES
jgi:hypothetical protein